MNSKGRDRALEILLVEDNPGDVRLAREALKGTSETSRLNVVRDGEEGLAFLRREGKYAAAPAPDVVLLDLNLPKKSGRQVLADMKGDPKLRKIPVVVLTSSSARQDVQSSYELHANCFVSKPHDLEQYLSTVRSIHDFWLSVAVLPSASA